MPRRRDELIKHPWVDRRSLDDDLDGCALNVVNARWKN